MDYPKQYRKLDARASESDAEIERYRRLADQDKWTLCSIASAAVESGEWSRTSFAKAVGRSARTINRQVKVWAKYAHLTESQRPSYAEAYDLTVGDDRPFGAPAKGAAEAAEVEAARRVLSNPRLAAEVLTPAAIAKQVADRTEVARAVARNDSARESVEEHGIEHRARVQMDVPDDTANARVARREKISKAFGDDLATEHLRAAARELMAAIFACEEYGIEDGAAEQDAIQRVERYLRLYKSEQPVTADDRQWAESVGVQL